MQLMNLHLRFRLFPETFETDVPSLTGASSIVEKANSFLPSANQSSRVVLMKATWSCACSNDLLAFKKALLYISLPGWVGRGCATEYMHVKDNRQFCGQNTLWRSPDRPFFLNLETTSFLIYENRSHQLRPNKLVDRAKRCLGQNANFAGDFPHPGPNETLQGEYRFSHLLSLHFALA